MNDRTVGRRVAILCGIFGFTVWGIFSEDADADRRRAAARRIVSEAVAIVHDQTLTGDGIPGFPLGVAFNQFVRSVNGIRENVIIQAGQNVNITPSGNNLVISSTGGALALPFSGSASLTTPAFTVTNGQGTGISAGTNSSAEASKAISAFHLPSGNAGYLGAIDAGVIGISNNSDDAGVLGFNFGQIGEGVVGSVNGTSAFGVYGVATGASSTTAGVAGLAPNGGIGIYGTDGNNSAGVAGLFGGRVGIVGTLTKSAGSFRIDHPVDPETKYLSHSFMESPDMKNFYDGVVRLDHEGRASIQLPEWFEALNDNFRYQLTCLGGFAPVYIDQEIANNSFTIAGGKPGMRVSWAVTGIRHDRYANAHRIPVEEFKKEQERGKFIHPELYGGHRSDGIMAIAQRDIPAPH